MATVTGTGSKWTNSSALYVGSSGTGTLNIESGGQVTALSLSINSTSVTGTTLLSFDVGPGLSDLHAWHYANNSWTAYDTHIVYRDDTASFTVSGFSAYAVTAVPEPGTAVMLAIGLSALGLYWRKRGHPPFSP